jgi:hypothetical protein
MIEMVAFAFSLNVVFLGGADFDTPPLGTTDCRDRSGRPRAR